MIFYRPNLTRIEKYNAKEFWKHKNKTEYLNIPFAFDIETSSFYENGEKRSIMYVWMFGYDEYIYYGRTWDEFFNLLNEIKQKLHLNTNRRILIYVHNLAFEFQFIRKWLKWKKVFAVDNRKPVYALSVDGFEFRCSYILSNYSLENVANNLRKSTVKKLVGDLDYSLIRHRDTPLTENELKYCENDIKIVLAYINECIKAESGNITLIPLTNTGYVRRLCRKNTIENKNKKIRCTYKKYIKNSKLTTEQFKACKRAFMGGFTHASATWSGLTVNNVSSFDLTSSYPTVMLGFKFPYGNAEEVIINNKADFEYYLRHYACIFEIEIENIEEKFVYEHILSFSKCSKVINPTVDNGRIVRADFVRLTLTEIDYFSLRDFYSFDNIRVNQMFVWKKEYLPKPLIEVILKLYFEKTELKGVDGKEDIYAHSKAMLNSIYGMTCTNNVKDRSIYKGNEWNNEIVDIAKELKKEQNKNSRFLYYPIGIYVTAYARSNLYSAILSLGSDYIYSDTDSVKFINLEKHQAYFENYNKWITEVIKKAMDYHGIKDFIPSTVNGIKNPIGVWDYEGTYERFKTLGAKRYMYTKNNEIFCTISGVSKKMGAEFLRSLKNPFDEFNDGLIFPVEYTGKKTLTYIDYEINGKVTDYRGNTFYYTEKSGVHLEGCEYRLNRSVEYLNFLKNYLNKKSTYKEIMY